MKNNRVSVRFEEMISYENLLSAWREFLVGKCERPDVQAFGRFLFDHLDALHADLSSGQYRHGPYEQFIIHDPKRRVIHKASVRDRLVHHAVHRLLAPFFDLRFIPDSFSCRLGKGTHRAVNRFRTMAYQVSHNHTRTGWVLQCDIRQCFASIDHDILVDLLRRYRLDTRVMCLLEQIIRSFSSTRSGIGLPLGNLTSQLLINVYLNELDQWMKHVVRARGYVRYADDIVIFSYDRSALVRLLPRIRDFLDRRLRLALHPNKIYLRTIASGVDFLGWVHFPDHRVLRTATKRRMFRWIIAHPTDATRDSYLGLLMHGNARGCASTVRELQWLYGEEPF